MHGVRVFMREGRGGADGEVREKKVMNKIEQEEEEMNKNVGTGTA